MPEDINLGVIDDKLVTDAQKYLSGEREFGRSYRTLRTQLFNLLQEVIIDTNTAHPNETDKLEKAISNSQKIFDVAIKSVKPGETPFSTQIKDSIQNEVNKILGLVKDEPKDKDSSEDISVSKGTGEEMDMVNERNWLSRTPKNVQLDPLPADLANHPDKMLPLVLQAKKEYLAGDSEHAFLELFRMCLGYIRAVIRTYVPYNYSGYYKGKESTRSSTRIKDIESIQELEFEALEPFIQALLSYEPVQTKDGVANTRKFTSWLWGKLDYVFANKEKKQRTKGRSSVEEQEVLDRGRIIDMIRGKGDTDHLPKYKMAKGSDASVIIDRINLISDGEKSYTEGTDFEVVDPDGIHWIEGGDRPAEGVEYKIDVDYYRKKNVVIPTESTDVTHGSGESDSEDDETSGATISGKIRDAKLDEPQNQYELAYLEKRIKDEIIKQTPASIQEDVLKFYDIMNSYEFSTEGRNAVRTEFKFSNPSNITDWLAKYIYPAVLKALEYRRPSAIPGSPVSMDELRSLKLRPSKDTQVPTSSTTEKDNKEDEEVAEEVEEV